MSWRPMAGAVLLLSGLLGGCQSDGSGPNPADPGLGQVTATIADPTGDTFGNRGVQWDLTALTVTRDTAGITVTIAFSSAPISPTGGDSNAMIAFVDFDTDQDSTTGSPTMTDEFRRDSGSTGMDSDFRVDLATFAADSTVTIFDASGAVTGHVTPVFSGKTVAFRIPHAMLGDDDGFLNAAAIVGTGASPTDIIPESGHLTVGPSQTGARGRPSMRAAPPPSTLAPRAW